MFKLRNLVGVACAFTVLFVSPDASAATHTYKVEIRRKVLANQQPNNISGYQMTSIRLTLSFATDSLATISAITVQITEPDKKSDGSPPETWPQTPLILTPSMAKVSYAFQTPPQFGVVIPLAGDQVTVSAPNPVSKDPGHYRYDTEHYQRYEIDIRLLSNTGIGCIGTQQFDPETYTITFDVTTTDDVAHPATISGQCLESYDPYNRSTPTNASCPGSPEYFVTGTKQDCSIPPYPGNPPPGVDCPATLKLEGVDQPITRCFKERPELDALLVLDRSGSMADPTSSGGSKPKIEALQDAVRDFVTAWDDARTMEQPVNNPDNIGVVLFDDQQEFWSDGGLAPGLNLFASPSGTPGAGDKVLKNLNVTNCSTTSCCTAITCGQLVPRGFTSIGGGLLKANSVSLTSAPRHAILLMTDGIENTDPRVEIDSNQVAIYCQNVMSSVQGCTSSAATTKTGCPALVNGVRQCTSQCPCPFPFQGPIYAVTVGAGTAVQGALIQAIAHASGGFYVNTEDNGDQLPPFFLELLQNVLKFHSYDTVRLTSATTPCSAAVPISTTSHDVEFSLMWRKELGALRLIITPPGGAQPIVQENASGFISIVKNLPLSGPYDPMRDWNIQVEAPGMPGRITSLKLPVCGMPVSGNAGGVPFDLHVMTDDGGVKSDLSIVSGDYKPGDSIRLRAKLTYFGEPILGLGSHPHDQTHPGDQIEVQLVRPGASIGDILSDSRASADPSGPDPQSRAQAKLTNTLRMLPSPLVYRNETVQLFDDGKPEHGDDVAGDGIYNALYPVTLPGHYNFLFAVENTAPDAVRFSRQQLRTAYVRAVPDDDQTKATFHTSIRPCSTRLAVAGAPSAMPQNAGGKGCKTLSVTMTPLTKFGNHLGPGWANYLWFTSPGVTSNNAIKAIDDPSLNGTYTATLDYTGAKPPAVYLHFENVIAIIGDSVTPDQLPQKLDGNNVVAQVPPSSSTNAGKFAVFADLGAGIPNGAFGDAFNTGVSFNGGLEYIVNAHFSAEGILGYHHFPGKGIGDVNVFQFTGGGKVYSPAFNNNFAFARAGLGGYHFSFNPGSTTNFGGYFGGGLLHQFGNWGLEGAYTFHAVNTPGVATKFSTVQGGIRWVF